MAMRNFVRGSSSSSNNHKEDIRRLRSLLKNLPEDADEQLIHFFHSKFPSPNQSTNQGQPGTKPSFLDTAKPWVEKVGNMALDKDLTKIGSEALKIVGASNPVLCALVFVGVALERILAVNPNEEKCLRLLAMMGTTVISLKDMRKHFQHSNKDVLKNALEIVLENCILCCDYLGGPRISKIWKAKSMKGQILEAQQRLQLILVSVNCAGIVELQRSLKELQQRNNYYVVPIDNILEIESPVGLQNPIEEVCKLLSMNEKHVPAVAVIISGLGGMGKTTLAQASIQRLGPLKNDFKFSRVIFNTGSIESKRLSVAERLAWLSHVKMLQQQLVNNLTGSKQEFGNTSDGRSKLKEVLQNTSSFIFIDNVNNIDDVEELLPKNLVLKQGTNLRILITSRVGVRLKVPRICTVKEYPIQSLGSEDAKKLIHRIVMDSLDDQGQVKFPGEMQKLVKVRDLCCGIPILLHLIGTHLRDSRSLECYDQIIEELKRGELASYSHRSEGIPHILLFVYEKMNADLQIAFLQIAFLDICGYMRKPVLSVGTGLSAWETVGCMVGENALENLLKKGLVQKQDKDEVIVHNILKTMMSDEIDKYSIRNFQNTQAIKGIERYVRYYARGSEVRCQDLDLLHSSLRFLDIEDFSGARNKCQATFVELRALRVRAFAPPFTSLEGFTNLTILVLRSCHDMTKLPSGIRSLICLRILMVENCSKLVSFPSDDLRSLTSLKMLSIAQCCNLKGLLDGTNMPQHLKCLTIHNCLNIKFSKGLANFTSLEKCHLKWLSSKEDDDAAMVPFKFPSTSSLKKLVLHDAKLLRTLKGDFDKLQNLETLCLGCDDVTDLSGETLLSGEICRYVTNLKKLQLDFASKLKSLPKEICLLTKLHTLDFSKCFNVRADSATLQPLKSLCTLRASGMTDFTPQLCSWLVNLEELELQNCSEEIENLPEHINRLSKLKTFRLINCPGLKNLPQNITMLSALQTLSLADCPKLKSLPKDIGMLPMLNALFLAKCLRLKTLPESIGKLSTLGHLSIWETQIPSLPDSWRNLSNLHRLQLVGIPMIEFPLFCSRLQNLEYLTIRNCVELISLPDNLGRLTNLKCLWCENIKVKALPQNFANLTRLRRLYLCNCGGLPEDVMDIILKLQNIRYLNITDSDPLIRRWRNLRSSQGIPQTNQIRVYVQNLRI